MNAFGVCLASVVVLTLVIEAQIAQFLTEASSKWSCVLSRATHREEVKKWIYLHIVLSIQLVVTAVYAAFPFLIAKLHVEKKSKTKLTVNVAISLCIILLLFYLKPSQFWEACVRTDLNFWRVKDLKDSLDNLQECALATSLHDFDVDISTSISSQYKNRISTLHTLQTVAIPSCIVTPTTGQRNRILCESCLHHEALALCQDKEFWLYNNKTQPALPFVDFNIEDVQGCCSMYATDTQYPYGPIHCEKTTQLLTKVDQELCYILIVVYLFIMCLNL